MTTTTISTVRQGLIPFAAGALLALLASPTLAQEPAAPAAENPMWEHFSQRFDSDGDGQVTAEEFDRQNDRFSRMDQNQDGVLTAEDFEGKRFRGRDHRRMRGPVHHLMRFADIDQNGELTRAEWTGYLTSVDSNTDGQLDRAELEAVRPADAPAPPEGRPQHEIELSVEKLTDIFDTIDRDADGVISADERPRRRERGDHRRGPQRSGDQPS